MRILISTYHRNVIGGTEQYLRSVMPGLIRRGHEVGLIYEEPFIPGQDAIDHPELSLQTACLAELGSPALMHWVSQWKPDVVYNQGLQDGNLEDALVRTYPAVLFAHNYYGTCGTGSKCHAWPKTRPCERRFGPACLLLHYPRRCGGLNPLVTWNLYRQQARRNVRLGDYQAILVASTHMRREFLNHNVSPEKVHLIPLPVPAEVSESMPARPRDRMSNILLVGRLTAVKGGHYLIQAIPQASAMLGRHLKLTIAGDGPERPRLERMARQLGLDVEFTGWLETRSKGQIMQGADLLAVPSLWPEPFGLVGIEGGSLGLPSVGFAVGGIPDWLIPGYSGELAPGDPPTVNGLLQAVIRALSDPEHYSSLRRGAWEFARRFTLEAHMAKLEEILCAQDSRSLRS